jgi:hypothetical protein
LGRGSNTAILKFGDTRLLADWMLDVIGTRWWRVFKPTHAVMAHSGGGHLFGLESVVDGLNYGGLGLGVVEDLAVGAVSSTWGRSRQGFGYLLTHAASQQFFANLRLRGVLFVIILALWALLVGCLLDISEALAIHFFPGSSTCIYAEKEMSNIIVH